MIKFIKKLMPDVLDVIALIGLSFIFWGFYQIYIPAAFIVSGVLLLAISYLIANRFRR